MANTSNPLPRPFPFLHATTRYHPVTPHPQQTQQDTRRVYHLWRSRDNRKGRHRAVVTGRRGLVGARERVGLVGEGASRRREIVLGLRRLVTCFPVWDVSYLVAVSFVLGGLECLFCFWVVVWGWMGSSFDRCGRWSW